MCFFAVFWTLLICLRRWCLLQISGGIFPAPDRHWGIPWIIILDLQHRWPRFATSIWSWRSPACLMVWKPLRSMTEETKSESLQIVGFAKESRFSYYALPSSPLLAYEYTFIHDLFPKKHWLHYYLIITILHSQYHYCTLIQTHHIIFDIHIIDL